QYIIQSGGDNMIINLNMNSDVPIYVQLRNEIVMGIGRGELKRGESLPTVRQMAADIGVNTMTVNKAYKILKDEGYIEIDRRHGAKVNPSINLSFEFKEKLESELELLVAESVLKGISKEEFLNMFNSVFAGMKGIVNN
ncbi:MAG: GntR family transcriptional regulator, partial [Clostridium paraputrificum]